MLVALDPAGVRLMAWQAQRGVAHRCPACGEGVRLKRGRKVIEHFAHLPGAACANAGETRQHLEMKSAIYHAIYHEGATDPCELEYQIGDRRADVWVPLQSGRKLAIECQHSPIPVEEVKQKIADYAAHGVDTLYVVHAEAFPDYDKRVGIASLHNREIGVREWVRAVTTPDLASARPEAVWDDVYVPYGREFVHVWADGRLWVLALKAVFRERDWGWNWDVVVLATRRDAELLGEIEEMDSPWRLRHDPGAAFYAAVEDLAALEEPHPSVTAAVAAAPPVLPKPPVRRGGRRKGCRGPEGGADLPLTGAAGPLGAGAPPRPTSVPGDAPQLGLGIEEPPTRPRRWADYD